MAAWKIPLAIGATLVGSVMQAQGQKKQYEAEARSAEYNAAVTRQEANAEEARRRRESQRQLGAIKAGRAKSGVTMEGTPLLVLEESAELAEIDALSAQWSGQASAKLDEQRARSARKAIPYAVGASLLSGVSSAATIGAMG